MAETPRPKRRHAAAASRVLVGGMSVATTLGLTAHWGAQAGAAETVELEVAAAAPAEPQQRIVIIRRIIREVYAEPTGAASDAGPSAPAPEASAAPAAATSPAPAPAATATPALPSAALAPPPAPAPAPATSSSGS